jgi:hypothetical protein
MLLLTVSALTVSIFLTLKVQIMRKKPVNVLLLINGIGMSKGIEVNASVTLSLI